MLDVDGHVSLVEIANTLGISESQARREVATAIGRCASALGITEIEARLVLAKLAIENSSSEIVTISRVPRRFSADAGSGVEHAPHVATLAGQAPRASLSPTRGGARRAGHLPRRFQRKP